MNATRVYMNATRVYMNATRVYMNATCHTQESDMNTAFEGDMSRV